MATGACATVNPTGTCLSEPTACSPVTNPVCGCDGKSYANDCEREAAGISSWFTGTCSSASCPTAIPMSLTACSLANISCVYSITTGVNAGCVERFVCSAGSWSAPVVLCPN
jgi:hypothetical protein